MFALGLALATLPAPAGAAYTVNTTADNSPSIAQCQGAPGDCALRQAIDEANATPGLDTVVLPAGAYPLTIKGAEQSDLSGDLDVTDGKLRIDGAGAQSTVIDATGLGDRIFDVLPATALRLSRLTITGGEALDRNGGGVRASEAKLELDRVAASGNTSTLEGSGGGLFLERSEVRITGSLISNNRNSGNGGGIYNRLGELSIENSTLADNVVDTGLNPSTPGWVAYGGAMELSGGTLVLSNVTIAGNSIIDSNGGLAKGEGSAIAGSATNAEIVHTIVSGNNATNAGLSRQCSATYESAGHNLESAPGLNEPRCFESPTDLIAGPLLGPLADNGGETRTMALLGGSPAIDAGNPASCPPADQRGVPRPQAGGCDIGAFESVPPPPASPPTLVEAKARTAQPSIRRQGGVTVEAAGATFRVRPGFVVSCPAGGPRCTGALMARGGKGSLVGKANFGVAPGNAKSLSLKLRKKGAETLRRRGSLQARFEVAVRAGGGPRAQANLTVKLRLPANLT